MTRKIQLLSLFITSVPLLACFGAEPAPEPLVWTDRPAKSESLASFYASYGPNEEVSAPEEVGAPVPIESSQISPASTTACTTCSESAPCVTCKPRHRSKLRSFCDWWHRHTKAQPCYGSRPFGECVHAGLTTQRINGLVDQQVLYNFDFQHPDTRRDGTLSLRGRSQIRRIANLMALTGHPVTIQSTGKAETDAQRKETVSRHLAELGVPVTPETISVARIRIAGLGGAGERAFPRTPSWSTTYENRMQQTYDRGSRKLLQTLQF